MTEQVWGLLQAAMLSPFVDQSHAGPTMSPATYMAAAQPSMPDMQGQALQQQQQQQQSDQQSMMAQQQQQRQLMGPLPTMESSVGSQLRNQQHQQQQQQQQLQQQQQIAQQMQGLGQGGLGHQGPAFQIQKQVQLESERNPHQDRYA